MYIILNHIESIKMLYFYQLLFYMALIYLLVIQILAMIKNSGNIVFFKQSLHFASLQRVERCFTLCMLFYC